MSNSASSDTSNIFQIFEKLDEAFMALPLPKKLLMDLTKKELKDSEREAIPLKKNNHFISNSQLEKPPITFSKVKSDDIISNHNINDETMPFVPPSSKKRKLHNITRTVNDNDHFKYKNSSSSFNNNNKLMIKRGLSSGRISIEKEPLKRNYDSLSKSINSDSKVNKIKLKDSIRRNKKKGDSIEEKKERKERKKEKEEKKDKKNSFRKKIPKNSTEILKTPNNIGTRIKHSDTNIHPKTPKHSDTNIHPKTPKHSDTNIHPNTPKHSDTNIHSKTHKSSTSSLKPLFNSSYAFSPCIYTTTPDKIEGAKRTRSGRNSIKPLNYWLNERIFDGEVYKRGDPNIDPH